MSFTDFKQGLQAASDYLDTKHHISGTRGVGSDALRGVVSAEYSFTLRELLCGLLAGNGVKLPNVQLCLHTNIAALLNIPNIQDDLKDALNELQEGVEQFMDHTKLDNVLGRLNGVLGEAQNVANMINFCKAPVDPIAIPNMLERAMGSFLGAGKAITDDIGTIATNDVCACISADGSFNTNVFNGGILGRLADNIGKITSGSLLASEIDVFKNDIKSIKNTIGNLVQFENNIGGSFSSGGSQFATPDANCNTEIGVLHNSNSGGIAGNARLVSQLKSLYDRLGGYPVQYSKGQSTGQVEAGHQYDSNNERVFGEELVEFPNIFSVLLDQELIDILLRDDNPQPNVDSQTPVFDYCGNIIGFTQNFEQRETETSEGSTPTIPNSPGHNAGGFTTDTSNVAGTGSSVTGTTVIQNFNNTGNTLYVVSSESAQNSLTTNLNDIVIRTDILTIFTRKDPSSNSTGTLSDYEQSTFTALEFLNNLNLESGSGLVVKDAGVSRARKIVGGSGMLTITNPDGIGGDIEINMAQNPRLPGTAAVKIPVGTTAQRPQTEIGEMRYNSDTDQIEAYYGDTGTWKNLVNSTSGASGLNLGSGSNIFAGQSGQQLNFRSLVGSAGITVTQGTNEITLADSITASNVGTGVGTFKARSANNFQFKSITSSDNSVTITSNTDTVDLSANAGLSSDALQTTDGTATIVQFGGTTPSPSTGKTWFFEVKALGVATSGEKQAFKVEGVVTNTSGNFSLVGTNLKIDYQRSTSDIASVAWDTNASYTAGDVVEYELNTYTANTNILGPYPNTNLSPDQDTTNWTVAYTGWNVNAEIIANTFRVRVKGSTGKTVNWKATLNFIEA